MWRTRNPSCSRTPAAASGADSARISTTGSSVATPVCPVDTHPAPGYYPLSVAFTRPLRDSDVDLYVSLGGRVDYRWDFINALSGVLPDRSIPVLRSRPDVTYVQAGGVACLA